jgi:cyclohexanone monooxygenase
VNAGATVATDVDVVVLGAGFAGLGMLHRLREMGLRAHLFEAADGVGGTWHWNRYPGARTDCEAWTYCFQFSPELTRDWSWSERYPSQPEMERYLTHVAERFGLFEDISLSTRVTAAVYDETSASWTVRTDRGRSLTAQFVVSGLGISSQPYIPDFPGRDSFTGLTLSTSSWPQGPVDLVGKRVALIGVGASGIQVLPEIAPLAAHVHVFQRTPNYVVPLRNHALDEATNQNLKDRHAEILAQMQEHSFALPFTPKGRLAATASPEELAAVYEEGWRKGGFYFLFETFDDILVDLAANKTAADFIRAKIRATVDDPVTAEALCPTTYAFGSKRPPGGTDYYEAYNRDNVTLVDLLATPLVGITPRGVRTAATEYEVDVIIYATGFDAVTGSWRGIEVRGRDGEELGERWGKQSSAYLGMATHGFPNLLMITGPTTPFSNIPAVIEKQIGLIGDLIAHMHDAGLRTVEADPEAEAGWHAHAMEVAAMTVVPLGDQVHSWLTGANIPGKPVELMFYMGGYKVYSDLCAGVVADGHRGFRFTAHNTRSE